MEVQLSRFHPLLCPFLLQSRPKNFPCTHYPRPHCFPPYHDMFLLSSSTTLFPQFFHPKMYPFQPVPTNETHSCYSAHPGHRLPKCTVPPPTVVSAASQFSSTTATLNVPSSSPALQSVVGPQPSSNTVALCKLTQTHTDGGKYALWATVIALQQHFTR